MMDTITTAADIQRDDFVRFDRFGAGMTLGCVLECYATRINGGEYVEVLLQQSPDFDEHGRWYRLPAQLRVEVL